MARMKGEQTTTERKPQRVTMETVGKIAGVSQVTVSRALSDPSKVSAKTLARIQDAIEATGFVPNGVAGALASNKSKLITALVPSLTNIVYSSMIQSFGRRMRDAGYQLLLSETGLDPREEDATIAAHLSRRPDAILLTGVHHSAQARRMVLAAGIPVVEIWEYSDTPIDMCVGFRHADTGHAAAEFAHRKGYARAATISAGDERARRRKAAFVDRLQALRPGAVPQIDFDTHATLARGREGLSQLLDGHGFDGGVIFCSSDILANGVLVEAQARGLRVPQDIAVIGFGDQDGAAHLEPPLTTIRVDREAFGRAAADILLDRFKTGEAAVPKVDLGFELIARGSA
ncbi:LacI family DNA-binding transcriptional regulator [Tropicibacter naphthalenivorans]|uniref:Gluconate utilization system GNT-I transcriptional repressor n=1 Tax=Tropicibacter naphthalenivorans TaxID=441103 RepID=A0A0P1GKH7_9RHOB|nr:LacI family DNA-binding transcriptional regulator [Tropicibacter naphthalenivorans]CUH82562.1 Gluconate utilization system GNT-I transcriptional repressor [Tropicibacter naphthalenivorans]SMD11819.1 transcriptional regulator, LacI family [Tropicibacter naphthalenivorans]